MELADMAPWHRRARHWLGPPIACLALLLATPAAPGQGAAPGAAVSHGATSVQRHMRPAPAPAVTPRISGSGSAWLQTRTETSRGAAQARTAAPLAPLSESRGQSAPGWSRSVHGVARDSAAAMLDRRFAREGLAQRVAPLAPPAQRSDASRVNETGTQSRLGDTGGAYGSGGLATPSELAGAAKSSPSRNAAAAAESTESVWSGETLVREQAAPLHSRSVSRAAPGHESVAGAAAR